MEYYIIQKKTAPFVDGGFWCVDIIVSSSETGTLYKDRVFGRTKKELLLSLKKGEAYIPKQGKVLEPYIKRTELLLSTSVSGAKLKSLKIN